MRHLRYLWLNGNQLTGTLPAAWGQLASVKFIDLSDNKLSGGIPGSYKGMKELHHLELHSGDDSDRNQWSEEHAEHEALLDLRKLVRLQMFSESGGDEAVRKKLHPGLHRAHLGDHKDADDVKDEETIRKHIHDATFFAFGRAEGRPAKLVDQQT